MHLLIYVVAQFLAIFTQQKQFELDHRELVAYLKPQYIH